MIDRRQVTELAWQAISSIITIDVAYKEQRSAYIPVPISSYPVLLSPYRLAMTQIFQLYIRSIDWEDQRQRLFSNVGGKCEECGRLATVAHHTDYRYWALKFSEIGDLKALCHSCHRKAHIRRDRPLVPFWAQTDPSLIFMDLDSPIWK